MRMRGMRVVFNGSVPKTLVNYNMLISRTYIRVYSIIRPRRILGRLARISAHDASLVRHPGDARGVLRCSEDRAKSRTATRHVDHRGSRVE